MRQQQDSIAHDSVALAQQDSSLHQPVRPQTPYQVLQMLPKDATPAQQDSAIQAWFQPDEVHYSSQPDTLHLPGHGVGHNRLKVSDLPKYYHENFFSNDSLLHPELNGGRYGVAGDPVPYTVRGDNFMTIILLGCFIMAVLPLGQWRHVVVRQLKDFFYFPHAGRIAPTETAGEVRYQLFMSLMTALLLAIIFFFYTTHYVADTFVLDEPYQLVGIFFAVFVAYFMLKALAYSVVNLVFFDGKKKQQWDKTLLFLTVVEGIVLLPVVVVQAYFDLSMKSVVYYFTFVLFLLKMLTFYKLWVIFFKKSGGFLQLFLYFCALELMPLLSVWGCLVLIVDELKINF